MSNTSTDSSPTATRGHSTALPRQRTIVACFDGTSNSYSDTNTNVVQLCQLLLNDDPSKQLVYYQPGVGTYFEPGVINPLWQFCAKTLDLAFAWYIDQHVMDGYKFLMNNHRKGDKICLFGFSRGAYTARALAGLLTKIGLLPKNNEQQVLFGYQLYKRTDVRGKRLAAGFKQSFSKQVDIDFVGVWDTVASVGAITTRSLPFTDCNISIKTFRHALSLDEHRARFRPKLYHHHAISSSAVNSEKRQETKIDPALNTKKRQTTWRALKATLRLKGSRRDHPLEPNPICVETTDVEEVWFAGCHGDVGGGSVPDDTVHSLGDVSLAWMIKEIMLSQCGILFNQGKLVRQGFRISAFREDPCVTSNQNALQPIYDMLYTPGPQVFWWILEILPTKYSYQDSVGRWCTSWRSNLGKGRIISRESPNFHVSVLERQRNAAFRYKPKAILPPNSRPNYVS